MNSVDDLEIPMLPSDNSGNLRPLNDPFLLGQIASLLCSLRSAATRKNYNDNSILKSVASRPLEFLSRSGCDALKYARIHKAKNPWQYIMIQELFCKLSSDVYSLRHMVPDQKACAILGFYKQRDYNFQRSRIIKCKRRDQLKQKKSLTESEIEELARLKSLDVVEGFERETE